jgi:hypothetical protein
MESACPMEFLLTLLSLLRTIGTAQVICGRKA